MKVEVVGGQSTCARFGLVIERVSEKIFKKMFSLKIEGISSST